MTRHLRNDAGEARCYSALLVADARSPVADTTTNFHVADHLAAASLWRAAKVSEFQHRLESFGLIRDAAAKRMLQRLHEVNEAVQVQQDQQAKQVSR